MHIVYVRIRKAIATPSQRGRLVRRISLNDKNQRHIGLIITVATLLATLSAAIFWVLDKIDVQVDERLGSSLDTVLKTTDQALKIWTEQTEIDVTVLAEDDQLRSYVKAQLHSPRHF